MIKYYNQGNLTKGSWLIMNLLFLWRRWSQLLLWAEFRMNSWRTVCFYDKIPIEEAIKNEKNEIGETHGTFFNLVFIDFFDNNYVIIFRKILKRNYWRIKKSSGLSDWNSRKIIGFFLVFSPGQGQILLRFLDHYDCKKLTN